MVANERMRWWGCKRNSQLLTVLYKIQRTINGGKGCNNCVPEFSNPASLTNIISLYNRRQNFHQLFIFFWHFLLLFVYFKIYLNSKIHNIYSYIPTNCNKNIYIKKVLHLFFYQLLVFESLWTNIWLNVLYFFFIMVNVKGRTICMDNLHIL